MSHYYIRQHRPNGKYFDPAITENTEDFADEFWREHDAAVARGEDDGLEVAVTETGRRVLQTKLVDNHPQNFAPQPQPAAVDDDYDEITYTYVENAVLDIVGLSMEATGL